MYMNDGMGRAGRSVKQFTYRLTFAVAFFFQSAHNLTTDAEHPLRIMLCVVNPRGAYFSTQNGQ